MVVVYANEIWSWSVWKDNSCEKSCMKENYIW